MSFPFPYPAPSFFLCHADTAERAFHLYRYKKTEKLSPKNQIFLKKIKKIESRTKAALKISLLPPSDNLRNIRHYIIQALKSAFFRLQITGNQLACRQNPHR
jgi:hypothetical protein